LRLRLIGVMTRKSLCFSHRRKGGPSPTFLPLEKLVVRTINILLMRPCLFNHLRARGIHVSIFYVIMESCINYNIIGLLIVFVGLLLGFE